MKKRRKGARASAEKKKVAPPSSTATNVEDEYRGTQPSFNTVSIREMLSGVKDYGKKLYINIDGTGNFAIEKDLVALLERFKEGD